MNTNKNKALADIFVSALSKMSPIIAVLYGKISQKIFLFQCGAQFFDGFFFDA